MAARADLAQALADGQAAAKAGKPPTACPHPAGNLLRSAWIRGYAAARPVGSK